MVFWDLAIHPLNPFVPVMAVPWGNLKLSRLLAMEDYNFHRVARLIDELAEEVDKLPVSSDENWQMASEVIYDDRPFHPQRLWDVYHQHMGTGIYRSKGFFWLPGRDEKEKRNDCHNRGGFHRFFRCT